MEVEDRLAIVGPTASGKSAVALAVARQLIDSGRTVEIVSLDSMCVYRGMDIGTAKASRSDRDRIRHHLLDLVEPDREFSVAQFQREARSVLADVSARQAVAILVGGTGLYVDAVVDDLTIPARFPDVRAELEREAATGGPDALHRRLRDLDPLAASRMEPGNARRIVRALEVTLGSGRPFSSYGPGLDGARAVAATRLVGLRWPRAELTVRIRRRLMQQMDDGFLDEARSLLERYGGRISRTASQALGYRELWEHLRGEMTLDDAIERIVLRSRQFAVRQERWFRRDARVVWLAAEGVEPDDLAAAALELH